MPRVCEYGRTATAVRTPHCGAWRVECGVNSTGGLLMYRVEPQQPAVSRPLRLDGWMEAFRSTWARGYRVGGGARPKAGPVCHYRLQRSEYQRRPVELAPAVCHRQRELARLERWMEVGVGPVRLGLLSLRLIVKMSRPSAWQIICHAGQLYTAEAHVTQR